MALKPILFKGEMIRQILAGRKTQTRRLVKFPPEAIASLDEGEEMQLTRLQDGYKEGTRAVWGNDEEPNWFSMIPLAQVGDILWVRETWMPFEPEHIIDKKYVYRADCDSEAEERRMDYVKAGYPYQWRPSLFMPYNACRLFLKVTGLRVERLNTIIESDAIAEGVASVPVAVIGSEERGTRYQNYLNRYDIQHPMHRWAMTARHSYETLWDKINGKGSWHDNPYVWVYTFERTDKPA